MQYTNFGKNNIKISRFGLGTMRLPETKNENNENIIDEKKAIEIIRYAIDNGVNYIDTAYIYAGSEVVVGKALKDGYREKVVLATKLPVWDITSKADVYKFFEEELVRLQTDYIDVYLLHNLFVGNWEKILEFDILSIMQEFKSAGKIKYIACSIHERFEHWKMIADFFDWDMMMMQYNYFDKNNQIGEKGLKYAHSKGFPVVIMESLRGGMLATEPPSDIAATLEVVPGNSFAEKAFSWLYDQEECSVILSGCNTLEQVKENIEIFNKAKPNSLTTVQRKAFDTARELWNSKTLVPCTGCKYCMPCPFGVDIPTVFEIYNNTTRVNNKNQGQYWLYEQVLISSKSDASVCKKCSKCEAVCPQKIEIIKFLQLADKELNS